MLAHQNNVGADYSNTVCLGVKSRALEATEARQKRVQKRYWKRVQIGLLQLSRRCFSEDWRPLSLRRRGRSCGVRKCGVRGDALRGGWLSSIASTLPAGRS